MIHNKLRNVEQFDGGFTDEWILGVTDNVSTSASGSTQFPTFARGSDFTAAAASQAITLLALNIGDFVHGIVYAYVENALTGTSITVATLSLGPTGATTSLLNAVDVLTNAAAAGGVYAPSATSYITQAASKNLVATIATTGANVSVLATGRLHIFAKITRAQDMIVAPVGLRYE